MSNPEQPPFYNHQESEQPPESIKSDKEITWEQKRLAVEHIADSLGKGIDEGIKEAVTALIVYGFPTSASCEGHLGGKHGLPYPWVEICVPEPEGWKKSKEKKREWAISNLREQQRMIELLGEFYKHHSTTFDARLSFRSAGALGGFWVQSIGAETMPLLSPEEQQAKLDLYRAEIEAFTSFLREKFFTE